MDDAIDWPARFAELAAGTGDARLQAYYRQTPPGADRSVKQTPLLALDLETSGLDEGRDDIISIGFIPFDARRIRCSGAEHWVVRPDRPTHGSAVTIHGITHSAMQAASGFEDYFEPLLQAMAGKVVVAHCAEIERRFLSAATKTLTGEPLHFPVIDTMALEAKKHPRKRPSLFQRWFGKTDGPSLRLDAARHRYGLPSYRPHHALTDALATAELLQAQLQDRYSPSTPVAQLWQ
jgi:DNA polymerase-3 subunit epsilon